jgi:MFS family permease
VSSVAIGVAVEVDVIRYWMLLAASAIQATAFAFYLPARIAFIAELVEPEQIGVAVVVSQTAQEAMRVVAPALAGVLIGVSWFGVGGVFLLAGAAAALSAFFIARLPPGAPRVTSVRSPLAEIVDAIGYVRSRRELSLIALTTIGVVVIGYPYLVFLPALADERFDVGAGGYGVMAGVAGLGAVIAGLLAPRQRWIVSRPWRVIGLSGAALGIALIALGFSPTYWVALLVLLAVGASGLVFQTSTQALMLSLSDFQYHGRMQSMVVLGFSGFGLAALPLGLFADATSLRLTLVGMGLLVLGVTGGFVLTRRRHRQLLVGVEPA